MERDILERLAVDHAAGELNDDVEVLFKTYLAEHPEADRWAREMLGAYEKTQAAIDRKTRTDQPKARPAFVYTKPPRQIEWHTIGRWAAVIVVAATLGASLGRWSGSRAQQDMPPNATITYRSTLRSRLHFAESAEAGFWQTKALALLKPNQYGTHKPYRSAVSLYNSYRQYVKERYHE